MMGRFKASNLLLGKIYFKKFIRTTPGICFLDTTFHYHNIFKRYVILRKNKLKYNSYEKRIKDIDNIKWDLNADKCCNGDFFVSIVRPLKEVFFAIKNEEHKKYILNKKYFSYNNLCLLLSKLNK